MLDPDTLDLERPRLGQYVAALSRGFFGRAPVGEIRRACLAALLDLGLTDSQIAAYVASSSDDIARLRRLHGLR
ncbi:hypothetical protein SAMN06265365_1527 [Tistlia consotensis]|uniref:Uncharacterized protein n=1 Tax=Tistlia consotensis USBA 355 TaxID=560819 RepID=A0A1Y6CQV3_9PROT|nr:hypothetical protein [Tistlia consotensis]SMF83992.1 hypothetical protein SAMN05428998_15213 [Tistlia consotensis USBA 355]SNS34993.1 hypothetical protein SAMN06265365_1527 [Tistlia consotensis]